MFVGGIDKQFYNFLQARISVWGGQHFVNPRCFDVTAGHIYTYVEREVNTGVAPDVLSLLLGTQQ